MPPVIDVHTHIFSALDIPLEGYLLARRSENPVGRLLDPVLSVFPMPQLFRYVASRARDRCVTRRLGEGDAKWWFYTAALWAYGKLALQRFLDWEDSLSSAPETNADKLIDTWPRIDLFVPLMIDYEYWFANSMDTRLGAQIDTVFDNVVLPHKGRIHPFVPFDPAREIAHRRGMISPDGQVEIDRPMTLVRDAIENRGFIGVKLYNSLGYRPLGNGDREVSLRRLRIAVRNNKMTYLFKGDDLDQVLCELYDYCVDNEVPITAHCVMNGIEAYPKASFHFGKAEFWKEVLKQDRYRKLRVNLAHFGWNQARGQGYDGSESWVKDICDLILEHDNLYTDVSHHRVLTAGGARRFVDGYRRMQRDYAGDMDKIKRRILYGSDWHVLRRLRRYRSFLDRYEQVLTRAGLFDEQELDAFRGGSAMEFLGLTPGGANRRRLASFYRANAIDPPQWFAAGDGTGEAGTAGDSASSRQGGT